MHKGKKVLNYFVFDHNKSSNFVNWIVEYLWYLWAATCMSSDGLLDFNQINELNLANLLL